MAASPAAAGASAPPVVPAPAPAPAPARPAAAGARLPNIPFADLVAEGALGEGSFGTVTLMSWAARGGTMVAVKCNGKACTDEAAIENERALYSLLLVSDVLVVPRVVAAVG